jgi:aryl-alcohol dehydrogenase-like predicted oxidoreductase
MARDEGMALAPWGSLGGGNFTVAAKTAANEKGRNMRPQSEVQKKMSKKLEQIANNHNTQITSVALAYVMHKAPYVFPIVGGRKVEHLKGNIEALGLQLSEQEIDEIDEESDFKVGFPMSFLFEFGGSKYKTMNTSSDVGLLQFAGKLDSVPHQKPITPHGLE